MCWPLARLKCELNIELYFDTPFQLSLSKSQIPSQEHFIKEFKNFKLTSDGLIVTLNLSFEAEKVQSKIMNAMLVLCNIFIANVILTLDNVEIMQSNVFFRRNKP